MKSYHQQVWGAVCDSAKTKTKPISHSTNYLLTNSVTSSSLACLIKDMIVRYKHSVPLSFQSYLKRVISCLNPYRSNILTSERTKREGKLYFPGVCLGKSDYFVFVFSLFFLMFGKRFLGLTHVKVTDGVMWSCMIAYANALYPHKAQGVLLFH